MSCKTQDIIIDCMDKRTLATFPGNKHLLEEGKLTDAKQVCMTALRNERSCNRGGKRRRRKSRRSRKSKRKSRRKKRRKSKKRKTRRRRRRRK
tara:strand:+ start:118 stop:396 length:279 start_codon:yes stop_codon:yes gene_type:complete